MAKMKYKEGNIGFDKWNLEEYGKTFKMLEKLKKSFFKEACAEIDLNDAWITFSQDASTLIVHLPLGHYLIEDDLIFHIKLDQMIDDFYAMDDEEGPNKSVLSTKLRELADKLDSFED
jgi:hypothetical protein